MNTPIKKTLVVGATEKSGRYANLAAYSLLRHGHDIELLGLKEGQIENHPIRTGQPDLADIDTVTMYVGARNQAGLYDYIKRLKPAGYFQSRCRKPRIRTSTAERGY